MGHCYLFREQIPANRLPVLVVDQTIFLSTLTCTFINVFAQVVITLRIYAITVKNRVVVGCCCVITIVQFILGLYLTATDKAQQMPQIPLDAYRVCTLVNDRALAITFVTLSSFYNVVAFLIIMYTAWQSNLQRFRIPTLLATIARDATHYFLIIFTSQLALEFTMIFGTPPIQLLPRIGNFVYLAVMVGRLMISLKKAVSSQGNVWSSGEPTIYTGIRFVERRGIVALGDEIHLETFLSEHKGRRSRA